jgi:hypothetical protein
MMRGHMVVTWAGPNPRLARLLLLLAVGVVGLASYDFLFVRFYAVGPWYAPVSAVFTSLLCLYGVERALDTRGLNATAPRPSTSTPHDSGLVKHYATLALLTTVGGALFLPLCGAPDYRLTFADFAIDEAPRLRAQLAGAKPKLIDCDDGVVAWASGFPSMSGTALGLDVEAARAYEDKGGLLPLAIQRGHTYLAQVQDIDATALQDDIPDHVRDWVGKQIIFGRLGDVKSYAWTVAYRSKSGTFVVVKAMVP